MNKPKMTAETALLELASRLEKRDDFILASWARNGAAALTARATQIKVWRDRANAAVEDLRQWNKCGDCINDYQGKPCELKERRKYRTGLKCPYWKYRREALSAPAEEPEKEGHFMKHNCFVYGEITKSDGTADTYQCSFRCRLCGRVWTESYHEGTL